MQAANLLLAALSIIGTPTITLPSLPLEACYVAVADSTLEELFQRQSNAKFVVYCGKDIREERAISLIQRYLEDHIGPGLYTKVISSQGIVDDSPSNALWFIELAP